MRKVTALIGIILILGVIATYEDWEEWGMKEKVINLVGGQQEYDDLVKIEETVTDNRGRRNQDKIQKLYMKIDDNTTYGSFMTYIKDKNLKYNEEKSKEGRKIKVALEKEVTPIRYAYEGDYVLISFNSNKEIEYVKYFNLEGYIEILEYRKGNYIIFENQPEYKGYYINAYSKADGTFKIQYDDEKKYQTNYTKFNSKEDQIKYLDKIIHQKKVMEEKKKEK